MGWTPVSGGGGGGGGASYAASPGDKPPDTPNGLDDEFNGTSLDGKWSWRNQGSATAAVGVGRLLLTGTSQSGVNLRIIEQTAPSTPWSITSKLTVLNAPTNFTTGGLIALDSGSGRLIRWGPAWDVPWKLMVTRYSSVTAFSSHVFNYASTESRYYPYVLRIEDDGTNLIFSVSPNGRDFISYYSEARTTFLTNGADRIGFGVSSENSAPAPRLVAEWFRVNWTPDYDPSADA